MKKHPFRRFLLWFGPILVSVIAIVLGFIYWLLASQAGAQWALKQGVSLYEGESKGVQGTIWDGLLVERLAVDIPDVGAIAIDNLALTVSWRQLWHRQLLVKRLSMAHLDIALHNAAEATEKKEDGPFEFPELPVSVEVQQLHIGEFSFTQNAQPLPVQLRNVDLQAALTGADAQLNVSNLSIEHDGVHSSVALDASLAALQAPWPFQLSVSAQAHAEQSDAMICANSYMDGLRHYQDDINENDPDGLCALQLALKASGSMDALTLNADAEGQGIQLHADISAVPTSNFPLRDSQLQLTIGEDTSLAADVVWHEYIEEGVPMGQATGAVHSRNVDIARLFPELDIPALLNLNVDYDVVLKDNQFPVKATLDLTIDSPTTWRKRAIEGHVRTQLFAKSQTEAALLEPTNYYLQNSDIDLRASGNQLRLTGGWGEKNSTLHLEVKAPKLGDIDPLLADVAPLDAKLDLTGDLQQHRLAAELRYQLSPQASGTLGEGEASAKLALQGDLQGLAENTPNWRASISTLELENAGLLLSTLSPLSVNASLPTEAQPLSVQLGSMRIQTQLNHHPWLVLTHQRSSYSAEGWETAGAVDTITISPERLRVLQRKLGLAEPTAPKRGGVKDNRSPAQSLEDLAIAAKWNLAFKQALSGSIEIDHMAGDVLIPTQPAFPLGLQDLYLHINLKPAGQRNSQVQASLRAATKDMGRIDAKVESILRYSEQRGFYVNDNDPIHANLNANIDNLGWTYLFLGDALDLQGALQANVAVTAYLDGRYSTDGSVTGKELRVTRLDDGVRLLDGELKARFDGSRVVLERLHFPAQLRVEPKEWRTAAWIKKPEAGGGSLDITGYWDLDTSNGNLNVQLVRYPILQRADRYAMISGGLDVALNMPHIGISGKIEADAGWFNLDMLGGIPTLDSDVVVLRAGETLNVDEDEAPSNISMSIDVDLGPRFYLTGYGVNSGLVGQLRLTMFDGELTALGALRTRGGAIEQYGQRLQLRRGLITFQGDIANPILDIEALRTGYAVEAGVAVRGTASNPRIDLVSYPDVDQAEKLSWLLFGHGSDGGTGDLALLFSVGSSLISGEEPLYRQFGIDEITLQTGEIGSAGSILPAQSTVKGLDDTAHSEAEQQFIQVTKALSSGIVLQLEQALTDTGTVGRASYRLARGLTAELSLGTVNGLALIYRWFSDE